MVELRTTSDRYAQAGHEYFELPPGVRVCDDEMAGGLYFLYRDNEVLCEEERVGEMLELIRSEFPATEPEAVDRPAVGGVAVLRLHTSPDDDVQTVDVVRRLNNIDRAAERAPRAGYHYVLTIESHVKWSPSHPRRPRSGLGGLPKGLLPLPGTGVRVGIPDTGLTHQPWFPTAPEAPADIEESLDANGEGSLDFEAGHGTFIAGIVLQHAPGATLVVRKLFGRDDDGCTDDLRAAEIIGELIRAEVHVLNLSFGGYTADNLPALSAVARVLGDALRENPDLVVVAAAGNDGTERPFYPAALEGVIATGALDAQGQDRAPFSNFGKWVDAWSTGESLSSTLVTWTAADARGHVRVETPPFPAAASATLAAGEAFEGWATWSGTSFAAPRVAAAIAAAISQDSDRPARQVVHDLVQGNPDRFESGARLQPASFV